MGGLNSGVRSATVAISVSRQTQRAGTDHSEGYLAGIGHRIAEGGEPWRRGLLAMHLSYAILRKRRPNTIKRRQSTSEPLKPVELGVVAAQPPSS